MNFVPIRQWPAHDEGGKRRASVHNKPQTRWTESRRLVVTVDQNVISRPRWFWKFCTSRWAPHRQSLRQWFESQGGENKHRFVCANSINEYWNISLEEKFEKYQSWITWNIMKGQRLCSSAERDKRAKHWTVLTHGGSLFVMLRTAVPTQTCVSPLLLFVTLWAKVRTAVPTQARVSLLLLFVTLLAKVRNAVPTQAHASPPPLFVTGNNSGCNMSVNCCPLLIVFLIAC